MKTAEEYIKEILGFDLDSDTTLLMVRRFKSYAKEVAEQALKDAADNLYALNDPTDYQMQQSIISTPILTP